MINRFIADESGGASAMSWLKLVAILFMLTFLPLDVSVYFIARSDVSLAASHCAVDAQFGSGAEQPRINTFNSQVAHSVRLRGVTATVTTNSTSTGVWYSCRVTGDFVHLLMLPSGLSGLYLPISVTQVNYVPNI